jgi:antitoxin component of MazEF toxin-antitoxin module
MLKKLVKYGNSNALILDRAILELLNINEGALVKICTDGKSLIITPQESKESNAIWMEGMERLEDLKNSRVAQMKKQAEDLKKTDPVAYQQMQELMPGTAKGEKLAQDIKSIMNTYKNDLDLLTTESFLQEVDALAAKYHNDKTSSEFAKEYFVLRLKHAPNLVNYEKEIQEVTDALGMPNEF